ncbi:MAG: pyridoxine 5'-phosphate synthase [Methylacidiphilales bacterium]|nr:pyridoxine 5'-phosphate synthase [Candidatus Methylacidiphilales bacterium]
MPLLGVNIDHIATIRQARMTQYPDPVYFAQQALLGGADFITFHLREDLRHIQLQDAINLISVLTCRTNLELSPNPAMIRIATKLKPSDCCLVPEKREELTTEGGLNLINQEQVTKSAIQELQNASISVSVFIDPDFAMIEKAISLKVPSIEIHTGSFASSPTKENYEMLYSAVQYAHANGLKVNLGHGLNQELLKRICTIPNISELNIGHAIISDAFEFGICKTVEIYKNIINESQHY